MIDEIRTCLACRLNEVSFLVIRCCTRCTQLALEADPPQKREVVAQLLQHCDTRLTWWQEDLYTDAIRPKAVRPKDDLSRTNSRQQEFSSKASALQLPNINLDDVRFSKTTAVLRFRDRPTRPFNYTGIYLLDSPGNHFLPPPAQCNVSRT